jgi:hypothetical protein
MTAAQQQQQEQLWTNSVFIPLIDYSITKPQLKHFFEKTCKLGDVSRVDFVSFNSDKGVGRRAFIHFSHFSNDVVKETLLFQGKYDTCIKGHTIRLIINRKPVPETTLNLNQVAHNTEFLGEEVKTHSNRIEELETKLKQLEDENLKVKLHVDQHLSYLFGWMNYLQNMLTPHQPHTTPIQEPKTKKTLSILNPDDMV